MAFHNNLGKAGEEIAINFLKRKNYEILDKNWTYRKSEIDIIAYRDSKIIFVEVKTRSSDDFGRPEEFVDDSKIKKIKNAAMEYIELMNHKKEVRFDVVSILFKNKYTYKLKHIEDAFWPQ